MVKVMVLVRNAFALVNIVTVVKLLNTVIPVANLDLVDFYSKNLINNVNYKKKYHRG